MAIMCSADSVLQINDIPSTSSYKLILHEGIAKSKCKQTLGNQSMLPSNTLGLYLTTSISDIEFANLHVYLYIN